MGIGFAIPINKAKSVQDQLARGEHIAHPYLGVQIADLTPEMAQRNNSDPNASMLIPEVSGVLVIRVLPETPAANAGLRRGDVITKIDEQRFNTSSQLQSYVDQAKIGQRLKVSLRRGEQAQTITIKAAELDLDN